MEDRNIMSRASIKNTDQEKYLERSLVDIVTKDLRGFCIKLLSTHITGLPDRLCLLPGQRAFFVELKTKGKKPSKIQQWVHEQIRSLGFRVHVVDSYEKLKEVIEHERNQSSRVPKESH